MAIRYSYDTAVREFYAWLALRTLTAQHHNPVLEGLVRGNTRVFVNGFHAAVRDYLAVVAMGEVRHAYQNCEWYSPDFCSNLHARDYIYKKSHVYDPACLKDISWIFNEQQWGNGGGGLGGKNWGRITDQAIQMFGDMSTADKVVSLDQTMGIVHNGGLAFNKNYLFLTYDSGSIINFLDFKRHCASEEELLEHIFRTTTVHRTLRQLGRKMGFRIIRPYCITPYIGNFKPTPWGTRQMQPLVRGDTYEQAEEKKKLAAEVEHHGGGSNHVEYPAAQLHDQYYSGPNWTTTGLYIPQAQS